MNVLILTSLLVMQCEVQILEKVVFSEEIASKCYITIETPDGDHMTVPVVNGYLPHINVRKINGYEYRTYDFNQKVVYAGGLPVFSRPQKERPRQRKKSAPINEEPIEEEKSEKEELDKSEEKAPVTKRKKSGMIRPSEILKK